MKYNSFDEYKEANSNKIKQDPLLSELVESLDEAIKYAEGKPAQVRVRTVNKITVTPIEDYTPSEIKALRLKKGLTQAVLAQIMGVEKSTIEKWESGKTKPNGPALRLLRLLQDSEQTIQSLYQVS